MTNQIFVPSLGESVTEATVSKWLKQVGESVDSDEPLVELETDKVNVEVPSPLAGTLSSIKVKEGDTVEVGALLGLIKEGKPQGEKVSKIKAVNQDEQSNLPEEKNKTKNIVKKISKKSKVVSSQKEDKTLTLTDENSNGALVLDTLAEDKSEKQNQKKYIC